MRSLGITTVAVCMLFLSCNTGSVMAASDAVGELFSQAVTAKGKDYFELKTRILKAENAGELIAQRLADANLTWRERVIGCAIQEELLHPDLYDDAAILLAGSIDLPKPSMRTVAPDEEEARKLIEVDPRTWPDGMEVSKLLKSLSAYPGLLAEVVLVHSEDTLAVLAARARAQKVAKLPPEHGRNGSGNTMTPSPEDWLRRWSAADRKELLLAARTLTSQALVFVASDDAVELEKELCKKGDVGLTDMARRNLSFIGTARALEALRSVPGGAGRD